MRRGDDRLAAEAGDEQSLRIGIDARAAAEVGAGRGRYVRELLRELAALASPHRFTLYTHRPWNGEALGDRFRWCSISAPEPRWNVMTARRAALECDVLLSTNSYFTAWLSGVPTLVVVQDMVPFDPGQRPQWKEGLIQRATLPPAVRRAASLITPSESTARELGRRFPAAAPKTVVIPLAADRRFTTAPAPGDAAVRDRHGLRRPYVLTVGTLEPRKNLPRLIEAFARLGDEVRGEHELVLAGAPGWDEEETLAAVAAHRHIVRAVGFVPDEDLPALYRGAAIFAYPSLGEGFGLPVLEAMSCGVPVLTSSLSSLPEVAGDAAVYVEPRDPADIGAALGRLLEDEAARGDLAERGPARAARFTWERTARATLAALEAHARPAGRPAAAAAGRGHAGPAVREARAP